MAALRLIEGDHGEITANRIAELRTIASQGLWRQGCSSDFEVALTTVIKYFDLPFPKPWGPESIEVLCDPVRVIYPDANDGLDQTVVQLEDSSLFKSNDVAELIDTCARFEAGSIRSTVSIQDRAFTLYNVASPERANQRKKVATDLRLIRDRYCQRGANRHVLIVAARIHNPGPLPNAIRGHAVVELRPRTAKSGVVVPLTLTGDGTIPAGQSTTSIFLSATIDSPETSSQPSVSDLYRHGADATLGLTDIYEREIKLPFEFSTTADRRD